VAVPVNDYLYYLKVYVHILVIKLHLTQHEEYYRHSGGILVKWFILALMMTETSRETISRPN
jgi:hypothetical protein